MRITHRLMSENTLSNLNDIRERMADLQNQIASGKRYQVPSDNPAVAGQTMQLRSQYGMAQTYLDIAQATDEWLSANELAFSQLIDIGTRALKLGYDGVSDTQGTTQRKAFADELSALLQQAVDVGNSTHKDNYIFSGHKILNQPFTLVDPNTVVYNGDQGNFGLKVSPGTTIAANIPGDVIKPFFDALIELRNALQEEPFDRDRLTAAIANLSTNMETLKTWRSTNGTRQREVRSQIDFLTRAKTELQSLLSQKEDANVAEAISMLRNQETAYQAALEVTRRAISVTSLFDLLR